jgi:hypothetical protein
MTRGETTVGGMHIDVQRKLVNEAPSSRQKIYPYRYTFKGDEGQGRGQERKAILTNKPAAYALYKLSMLAIRSY